MNWTMPAETAAQKRVWMAFPHGGYTLGDTEAEAHAARSTWANVAHAVAEFAPVSMVVDPADTQIAAQYLEERIEIRTAELNDAWMRDIGPTFVTNAAGELAAVDWVFNGWGAQDWAAWDKDALIGAAVAGWAGVPRIASALVNEGGAIHVDGEGTVLATESVQLDPGRNPGTTKEEVEAEFARTLGATKVHWLPRGLARDSQEFGTRGHVDIVATIPSPGTVLVHSQLNPEHPDHAISRELIDSFRGATDARGREFNVIEVPAPTVLRDTEGFVDYSYINHLVINDGVVACTFDDPNDEAALAVLAAAYPGRKVVGVDARELYARGGGIHCITQQEPVAGELRPA
jgi:agmatine deiminase